MDLWSNRAPIATPSTPTLKGTIFASTSIFGTGAGRNCLYTFATHQDFEASPDVVMGMLRLFSHNLYCLLDPGSILSCVNLYMVVHLDCGPESLLVSFSISTSVEDSVIARKVYRCVVSVGGRDTLVDCKKLAMVY